MMFYEGDVKVSLLLQWRITMNDIIKKIRNSDVLEDNDLDILYALKKLDEDKYKCLIGDLNGISEEIREIEIIGDDMHSSFVPIWDFNVDDYLLCDLQNGYELEYMPLVMHSNIWYSINAIDYDIEHMDGFQNYMKYCKSNNITKESFGADFPLKYNIMKHYIEMNDSYEVIADMDVGDTTFVLACSKENPSPYVTWETNRTRSYYVSGNYFRDYDAAYESFKKRIQDEITKNLDITYQYLNISMRKVPVSKQDKNINDMNFELIELFGKDVLFIDIRIPTDIVPKGLYKYEVREDDESQGIMCELNLGTMVNFYGTILSKEKIPLNREDYRIIDEAHDVVYPKDGFTSCKIDEYTSICNKKNKNKCR